MSILTIALALLAAGDPGRCARAYDNPDRTCQFFLAYSPSDASRDQVRAYYGNDQWVMVMANTTIWHKADPGTWLTPADARGRTIRTCSSHGISSIEILGGTPPRDFAMAMALAEFLPRPNRMTPAEALVQRGLGHELYHTRQAAHGCLVRMGTAAIVPCLAGLSSRDPEVRLRCSLILDEIRCGSED